MTRPLTPSRSFLVFALLFIGCASAERAPAPSSSVPAPPRAMQTPHPLTDHGVTREDPWYWLRDDERKHPAVLAYLNEENAYAEESLAHLAPVREALFDEIVARLPPDDVEVPVFVDGYWHYSRFEAGKEQPIFCRRRGTLEAAEEVLLDANVEAEPHAYYRATSVETTRAGDLLAWAEDTLSRRIYTIKLKDLATGRAVDDTITGTSGDLAFSDAGTHLFYVRREEGTLRAYQVWRHRVGTPAKDDVLVYEEADSTYEVSVSRSKSNRYMVIHSNTTVADEVRIVDAQRPETPAWVFLPRARGHEYRVAHAGEFFYVRTNHDAENFRLMRVRPEDAADLSRWQEVIPHRSDVLLEGFDVFRNFLVLEERADANTTVRVIPWANVEGGHTIASDAPAFATWIDANPEFDTDTLRFGYGTLTTPDSIFDYDMNTRQRVLKKRDVVLGDFDLEAYESARIDVKARDGALVPVSLVYRKDLDRSVPRPLYLYGYGSYGLSMSAYFSSPRLSLLDRGVIFAVAHIRGGSERGRPWYEAGKLMHKRNTFTDFIDVTEALQAQGMTTPRMTVAMGGSAGGLLMGAVANMAPERYAAIVAYVPFVDVVTTMLDETIPLTTFEYDEWGNPHEKAAFDYMLSYSPYDNVKAQAYPNLLVITGLHDSQVQYWEPAKWVAKLRATKTDANRLYLKTDMDAGHGGASGRFKRHRDRALEYAFLFDVLGIGHAAEAAR